MWNRKKAKMTNLPGDCVSLYGYEEFYNLVVYWKNSNLFVRRKR